MLVAFEQDESHNLGMRATEKQESWNFSFYKWENRGSEQISSLTKGRLDLARNWNF